MFLKVYFCISLITATQAEAVGPKMVFGHSKQLPLNKFFDPSTPSMRKVDDATEIKEKEKNGVFSGHWVGVGCGQSKVTTMLPQPE